MVIDINIQLLFLFTPLVATQTEECAEVHQTDFRSLYYPVYSHDTTIGSFFINEMNF